MSVSPPVLIDLRPHVVTYACRSMIVCRLFGAHSFEWFAFEVQWLVCRLTFIELVSTEYCLAGTSYLVFNKSWLFCWVVDLILWLVCNIIGDGCVTSFGKIIFYFSVNIFMVVSRKSWKMFLPYAPHLFPMMNFCICSHLY